MEPKDTGFLKLLEGKVQYVVPYWQRRYCWEKPQIERLIDDLVAVAETDDQTHYGGTLLISWESGAPGELLTKRVIDG